MTDGCVTVVDSVGVRASKPWPMNRYLRLVSFCALLFLVGTTAWAAVMIIYDQGSPNLGDGSFEMTHYKVANRFTLGAASIVTNVKYWDLEASPDFQGSVYWEIRSNTANNTPGAVLFSGSSATPTHVATNNPKADYPEYVIAFDVPAISLGVGSFWLVLHNGPFSYTLLDNNTHHGVFWEAATTNRSDPSMSDEAPFTNEWGSNDIPPGSGYPAGNSQLAFQLNGVPESYRARITTLGFASNGAPRVSFTTFNGQHYRVDYTNTLTAGWTTLSGASNVSGTGNVVTVTDTDPNIGSVAHRFYRVVLL